MTFGKILFVCGLILLHPVAALAQPADPVMAPAAQTTAPAAPPATLKDMIALCVKKPDRAERLICYDEIAIGEGLATQAEMRKQQEVMDEIGLWKIVSEKDSAGLETISLKLKSDEVIRLASGKRVSPELIITCKEAQTNVYVDWRTPLAPPQNTRAANAYVMHRFDLEPALSGSWPISLDKLAVFTPDPVEFTRKLRTTKKLTVQMTPHNESAYTLVYSLKGMENALNILVKRCYN